MTVHLVGAGPGDPELLTVRAVKLLRQADVVVHDRLVNPAVLDLAPPWAERIDVGKAPGVPSPSQTEINAVLIDRGSSFECVVRLKGGDPFVFGRGGEEAVALRSSGLDVEVVPGVTSAVAAPAAAGIPVTMRGVASGFTVVTAHQDPASERQLDWDALARSGTTLVILMGAARAAQVADRLLVGGMGADTPVAVISSATTSTQNIVRTTLEGMAGLRVRSPATIVVGPAASADVLAGSEFCASGALTESLDQHPHPAEAVPPLSGAVLDPRCAVPELAELGAPSALTAQGALP